MAFALSSLFALASYGKSGDNSQTATADGEVVRRGSTGILRPPNAKPALQHLAGNPHLQGLGEVSLEEEQPRDGDLPGQDIPKPPAAYDPATTKPDIEVSRPPNDSTPPVYRSDHCSELTSLLREDSHLLADVEFSVEDALSEIRALEATGVEIHRLTYRWRDHTAFYPIAAGEVVTTTVPRFLEQRRDFVARQRENLRETISQLEEQGAHEPFLQEALMDRIKQYQIEASELTNGQLSIRGALVRVSSEELQRLAKHDGLTWSRCAFRAKDLTVPIASQDFLEKVLPLLKPHNTSSRVATTETVKATITDGPAAISKWGPAMGMHQVDLRTPGSMTIKSYFWWTDTSGFTDPHVAYEHDIRISPWDFLECESTWPAEIPQVNDRRNIEWWNWFWNVDDRVWKGDECSSASVSTNLPGGPGGPYVDIRLYDRISSGKMFGVGTSAAHLIAPNTLYEVTFEVKLGPDIAPDQAGKLTFRPNLAHWQDQYDGDDIPSFVKSSFCGFNGSFCTDPGICSGEERLEQACIFTSDEMVVPGIQAHNGPSSNIRNGQLTTITWATNVGLYGYYNGAKNQWIGCTSDNDQQICASAVWYIQDESTFRIRDAYFKHEQFGNDQRYCNKVGIPFNDGGPEGGEHVHEWNGLYLQNFRLPAESGCPTFNHSGDSAIIYNKRLDQAFLVKEDLWDYYAQNNGPIALGPPTDDEEPLPSGSARQSFEKGCLIRDIVSGAVGQHHGIDCVAEPPGVNLAFAELAGVRIQPNANRIEWIVRAKESTARAASPDSAQRKAQTIDLDEVRLEVNKTFLQALAVPDYKHRISLDIIGDGGRANVPVPFERTDMADAFLHADVAMKFDLFGGSDLQQETDIWTELVQQSPFWFELEAEGFVDYPSWVIAATIVPGRRTAQQTDRRIVVEDVELDLDAGWWWQEPVLDLSYYNLSAGAAADLLQRLGIYKTTLENIVRSHARNVIVPEMNRVDNIDPRYKRLKAIYSTIAIAQWYKEQVRLYPNLPFADLVDSEDLTGIDMDTPFNQAFWDGQANQTLWEGPCTAFWGETLCTIFGGLEMEQSEPSITGQLAAEREDLVTAVLDRYQVVSDENFVYTYGDVLTSPNAEIILTDLTVSPTVRVAEKPVIFDVEVHNSSVAASSDFAVVVYDDVTNDQGQTVRYFVGQQSLSLAAYTGATLSFPWTLPETPGDHVVLAIADTNSQIPETNETDNSAQRLMEVFSPVPTAEIHIPFADEAIDLGSDGLTLSGEAWDPEEGKLSGAKLLWTSDLDGVLGIGDLLIGIDLSIGLHTLTLTVTDSEGLTATDTVSVTVTKSHCVETLAPLSFRIGNAGGSGAIAITAPPGCTWEATIDTASATFLTLDSGSDGQGNGMARFTLSTNDAGIQRTARLEIGGRQVLIRQAGAQVAAGSQHSLYLSPDGALFAWGANAASQLGDSTNTQRSEPVPVLKAPGQPLTGVAAVTAFNAHTLALLNDGTVLAWGWNAAGQLGDGTQVNRNLPVPVLDSLGQPLIGITDVTAGGAFSLALVNDGTVLAWGNNFFGQLSDGTQNTRLHAAPVLDVSGQPLAGIVAIAAGENHALALASGGEVYAWGINSFGQLGDNSEPFRTHPVRVLESNSLSNETAEIAAGTLHSMARSQGAMALAWGGNENGQLGDGTTLDHIHPGEVLDEGGNSLPPLAALGAGSRHTLAVTVDGRLYAWGRNSSGQLGDGTTVDRPFAALVTDAANVPLSAVRAVAGGFDHSLALTDSGLWLWGENGSNQLGDGSTTDRYRPVTIEVPPRRSLIVSRTGTGSGTVTSDPSGISCGSDCGESYPFGTVVTLTATSATGSTFTGWSGSGCSGTGTCVVTMDQARSITATFNQFTYALNVSVSGTGAGTVMSSPTGIGCGIDCTESYPSGTVVTLAAAADTGSIFSGWSGSGCGGVGSCVVTMSQARFVTAIFGLQTFVVISEVFGGNPDYVEVYNPGPLSLDLNGWILETTGCGPSRHVLPAFALEPGQYVQLVDTSGTNTVDTIYLGANICWNPGSAGSASLSDPASGVDFVRWGNSTTMPPVGTTWNGNSASTPMGSLVLGRDYAGTDTDSSIDWCPEEPSAPGPNPACRNLVLNEVFGGAPDYVELYNPTATAVDLNGWILEITGCGSSTHVLPSFNLNPGQYVQLVDTGGTNTVDTIYLGANICWNPGDSGSAALSDSTSGVDFVRWGGSTAPAPDGVGGTWKGSSAPAATGGLILGRDSLSSDTDSHEDWCPQNPSVAGVNPGCSQSFELTVFRSGVGVGSVTSSPTGIDCGGDCSESYLKGTVVTLTAVPATGSVFSGWSGSGCSGTGLCTVTLDQMLSVTAGFESLAHTLNITKSGNGSGTVTSSPIGINCGNDCNEPYVDGTMVFLTATPDAGSVFLNWSGSGCSGNGSCVVNLDQSRSVIASFELAQQSILINEIFGDTPDYVELYNLTSDVVNLDSWVLETTGCDTNTHVLSTFFIAPGQFVKIVDGSGTNTSDTFYLEANICWNPEAQGSVALSGSNGWGVDFVRWGGSTTLPPLGVSWSGSSAPAPATGKALGRTRTLDTDSSADWCNQAPTAPGANAPCDSAIFSDGFESGSLGAWSTNTPSS